MTSEINQKLLNDIQRYFRTMITSRFKDLAAIFEAETKEDIVPRLFSSILNVMKANPRRIQLRRLMKLIVYKVSDDFHLDLPRSSRLRLHMVLIDVIQIAGVECRNMVVDLPIVQTDSGEVAQNQELQNEPPSTGFTDIALLNFYDKIYHSLDQRAGNLRNFSYTFHNWLLTILTRAIKKRNELARRAIAQQQIEVIILSEDEQDIEIIEVRVKDKQLEPLVQQEEVQAEQQDEEVAAVEQIQEDEEEGQLVHRKGRWGDFLALPETLARRTRETVKAEPRDYMKGAIEKKAQWLRERFGINQVYMTAIRSLLRELRAERPADIENDTGTRRTGRVRNAKL